VQQREPFGLIVCGVDGSPSALEGVRQAGALASANTTILLIAVTDEWGTGLDAGALLSKRRAEEALAQATAELAVSPARVIAQSIYGNPPYAMLLDEAARADLLVVGRHSRSRAGGILIGTTATTVLHEAKVPVLVAVRPEEGLTFPARILVAADGPDHPEHAIELAGQISGLTDADITLLRVDWSRRAKRPEIAQAVAGLRETTNKEPFEILVGGTPHHVICDYAQREGASLVITGSRGVTGVRALRSVSERVAHECGCSVLVIHGELTSQ
jgi:nucleotide-binding universal stress UspA family protein